MKFPDRKTSSEALKTAVKLSKGRLILSSDGVLRTKAAAGWGVRAGLKLAVPWQPLWKSLSRVISDDGATLAIDYVDALEVVVQAMAPNQSEDQAEADGSAAVEDFCTVVKARAAAGKKGPGSNSSRPKTPRQDTGQAVPTGTEQHSQYMQLQGLTVSTLRLIPP